MCGSNKPKNIYLRYICTIRKKIVPSYLAKFSELQSFYHKNTAYASIDDIFLLKVLHIPNICSTFAADLRRITITFAALARR